MLDNGLDMVETTEREMQVLKTIAKWLEERGRSPTLREMGAFPPPRTAHAIELVVNRLEGKRLIRVKRTGRRLPNVITIEPLGVALLRREDGYFE